jgi:excisionase family DNA binding protein
MRNSELYSAEQVAERLGLHVRTVRNYVRDGRLKAVRIGKQYRIASDDLVAFTGQSAAEPRPRGAEVSSVVQIDGIGAAAADRLSTLVVASAQAPRDTPDPLRIQTIYDQERAQLKIVIFGGAGATADVLRMVEAVLGPENDMFLPPHRNGS